MAEAGEGAGEIDGVGSVGGEWRLACALRVVQPTGVRNVGGSTSSLQIVEFSCLFFFFRVKSIDSTRTCRLRSLRSLYFKKTIL